MSGRGRGRGRGSGLSFNTEALGIGRGEAMPVTQLEPPPTFPPLENQPAKLDDVEGELMVAAEKRLKEALKLHNLGSIGGPMPDIDLPWQMLPAELRLGPQGKRVRKSTKNVKPNLVKRSKDVTSTLEALEKKEVAKEEGAGGSDDEKADDKDDNEEEEEKKVDEVEEEDADEPDEEMDGGTDYANQYFDNGEEYLDEEDDALEEGGVF